MMTEKLYAPIHPGEVLMEDFIEGFGITQHKLAVSFGVPPRRINEIVRGKRAITAGGVTNRAVLCPDGVLISVDARGMRLGTNS